MLLEFGHFIKNVAPLISELKALILKEPFEGFAGGALRQNGFRRLKHDPMLPGKEWLSMGKTAAGFSLSGTALKPDVGKTQSLAVLNSAEPGSGTKGFIHSLTLNHSINPEA